MKLTLNAVEINLILLDWAQKHFPQGDFNVVAVETYSYSPNATFTHEEQEEAPVEAL
jgi:hypothetical protein